jgi:hypothetical protein
MPVHRIQGPDGKIHRVEAPANANPAQLTAFVASQFAPKEEEPGIFDKIQSVTTDVPARAIKGALGGVEAAANIFGADNPVSELLRGAQEGINEYLVSDTAKRAAEERSERFEGKGFLGSLAEIPGALADDPVLLLEALGTAAPSLAAAAFTGGSSAAVQGAALLGTGAAMGAGTVKGSIYAATKNELMRAGASEADAEAAADEAQSYAGENLDMIALGTALGAVASRTGIEPAAARLVAGRILGKSVGQAAGREGLETALLQTAEKGALRGAATEAVTEGAQGGQERLASNLALQRQGFDTDLMEGVGSAVALEGTLGGIVGGGFGVAGRRADVKRRLAAEDASLASITGEGPRAPEGFESATIEQRLRAAAGEDIPAAQRRASAISEKLNNDIAFGTPEKLAETTTYLDDTQNQIDSGAVPEAEIEPLQRTIDEARAVLGEFSQTVAPAPEVEPAPEVDPFVKEYVDRYMAGEGRGDTDTDLQMQQFAANNPEAIEAEFARRTAEEAVDAGVSDVGGSEPVVPDISGGVPAAGVAAAPEPDDIGGLGVDGTPAGQPNVQERAVERPLGAEMTLPKLNTVKGITDLFERKFNYKFADAPKITEFFKDVTGLDTVPEEMNLERAFELFQTKKNAAQRELSNNFELPLLDSIKRERVPLSKVATFLMARAAPAKNRLVAEVNAAFPEGGSGVSDAEAAADMADLEAQGLLPKLERIAKKHDELVDWMGEERIRSGLIPREDWQAMRAAQPFYTPFKGFAAEGDTLTADVQDNPHSDERRQMLSNARRGLGMREFFQAKGRNSLPFHPLFNLLTDAEALVRRTAMNDVYTTFERMVEANPEGMRGFIQGIYTDTQPKKVSVASKENPAGREFNANMAQEVMNDREGRYHVYKSDGVTKYLEFKNNEAGRAAQRLFSNMQPEQMSRALEIVTDVNNALKAVLTYRNPVYLTVVAPLRDTLDAVATAMLNRNIKGSPAYKKKLARKVAAYSVQPAMWRTITRYSTGREALSGREDLMPLLEQMLIDGGAPMGTAFRTVQDRATDALKDLEQFRQAQEGDMVALTREGAAKVGKFFDRWAEINDLVPRFATYRAAIEEGLTGPEAASLALDSSLNLTRRGEMATLMDNLVPFFSAGVEGSRKVIRIVKNPKTMAQVVGGMMAIGMAESLANASFGGDEDDDGTPDYLDINPGTRMTRMTVYYGKGGDDYVSIPVGQMLGYFKYIGNKIADTWLEVQSGEEAALAIQDASFELIGGLLSLLSPARVQGGDLQSTLVSLTPLWGKPIADLAINQNFFGTPIYQQEREDTGPAAELGRATTGEMWKSIARGLNEITGGSPATGGYLNFQPEVYRYILETYLGGWARLAEQTLDFAEEPTTKNIPIVQGFLGKGFDYTPQNKYKKNTEVLSKIVTRIDKLSDAQLQREMERNPVALDPRVIEAYEETDRALQRLYRQRREDLRTEGLDGNDKRALTEYYRIEMNKWQSAFNYVYDAVEEGQ